MYDCHIQSVNNSLFSLCLYFDFTINYGQHSPMFVFVIVFEGESTEGGARWRRRSKWVKRINLPPLFPPPPGSAIQASKHNYSELERLLSIKRYYKALYWWWMLCFFDIILLPLIAFRDQYKGNRKSRFATSEHDYATLPKDVANTSGGWSLGGEEGAPPPD